MSEPITVSCPACETEFPVDPAKVPPGGVRARCSVCEEIFPVEKPGGDEPEAPGPDLAVDEPAAPEEPPEEPEEEPGGAADAFGDEAETFGDEADAFGAATAEEEEPEAAPADAGDGDDLALEVDEPELDEDLPDLEPEAAEAEEEEEEPAAPAFGQRTPEQKAQRLARVLVSDMISYNPELHQKALERGTLEDDFEEEIEMSWEEYVEQVGEEIADSTTFWTDALNEILAEGEEIF